MSMKFVLLVIGTFYLLQLIPSNSAEPIKCGKNEMLTPGPLCCEPTCTDDCSGNPEKPNCCNKPTCVCKLNFVRHKGKCIRKDRCPKNATNTNQHNEPSTTTAKYLDCTRNNLPKKPRCSLCNFYERRRPFPSSYNATCNKATTERRTSESPFMYNTKCPSRKHDHSNDKPKPPITVKESTTLPTSLYHLAPFYPRNTLPKPDTDKTKSAESYSSRQKSSESGEETGSPITYERTTRRPCKLPHPRPICRRCTTPSFHTTTTPPCSLSTTKATTTSTTTVAPTTITTMQPTKQCSRHQKLTICRPLCIPTCDNDCSNVKTRSVCIAEINCICIAGYVWHEGKCIRKDDCPPPGHRCSHASCKFKSDEKELGFPSFEFDISDLTSDLDSDECEQL